MAKSGANPEAMDNMVRILTKFIDLQDNVVENLKTQYDNVGEDWDDQKYLELATIKGSYSTLSTCITKVQLLKTIMEDYLSQHMG